MLDENVSLLTQKWYLTRGMPSVREGVVQGSLDPRVERKLPISAGSTHDLDR